MIRIGEIEDAELIAEIVMDTWKKSYVDVFPTKFLESYDYYKKVNSIKSHMMELPRQEYFIIFDDKLAIGTAKVRKVSDNICEIAGFYIRKEYQKCGYGRILLRYLEEYIFYKGYDEIWIWVLIENKNGCQFYENNKYIATDNEKMVFVDTQRILKKYIKVR